MTKKRKNWWIWALVGLLVILLAAQYIKRKNNPSGKEVVVEKVENRTIKEMVFASGKIFPEKEVVISSDVSGEVVALYVKEGDTVKEGQLLAKINPDTYLPTINRGQAAVGSSKAQAEAAATQIQSAMAQLEQAKAQLENAKQINDRNNKLFSDGVISKADLEASQTSYNTSIAAVRSAEAAVTQAKKNENASKYNTQSAKASLDEMKTSLNKTMIYAPASGVISKLNVEKGERVLGTIQMSGTNIMTISNLDAIEVQVEVSENDIVRVSKYNKAEIEVDAFYGKKFSGVVTEIAGSSANSSSSTATTLNSSQVTTFIVKVLMDYASYKDMIKPGQPFPFRPGMSASVSINTNTIEQALSVPIQAVTTRADPSTKSSDKNNDLWEVVFVKSGDTAKMVRVTTGIQDDEFIQIINGLTNNQEIISGPYAAVSRDLNQGDKVRIRKETTVKNDQKEESK